MIIDPGRDPTSAKSVKPEIFGALSHSHLIILDGGDATTPPLLSLTDALAFATESRMTRDLSSGSDGGGCGRWRAISVQVLNEFANVARREMQMSWADTHTLLTMLRGLLTVHPLTLETHETGLGLAERYGLSTYDAMIAASALHAGCNTLWSEDMHHGMTLDEGLRIVNPFRELR